MAEVGTPLTAEVRARVENLFRAFNEHDVDKITDLHTPDAVWEDPELAAPIKGRAAIAAEAAVMLRAFPDLQFVLDELEVYVANSGRVAARWHWVGTMTGPIPPGFAPTGKKVSLSGVCLYEFDGGLIAHHTIIYDGLSMLRQLGFFPARDSAAVKLAAGAQRAVALAVKTVRRH